MERSQTATLHQYKNWTEVHYELFRKHYQTQSIQHRLPSGERLPAFRTVCLPRLLWWPLYRLYGERPIYRFLWVGLLQWEFWPLVESWRCCRVPQGRVRNSRVGLVKGWLAFKNREKKTCAWPPVSLGSTGGHILIFLQPFNFPSSETGEGFKFLSFPQRHPALKMKKVGYRRPSAPSASRYPLDFKTFS